MATSSNHEEAWLNQKMSYFPEKCPSCQVPNSLIPTIKGEPGFVFSKFINENRLHLVDISKYPKENSYCKNCKEISFIEIITWTCNNGHSLRFMTRSPYVAGEAICDICGITIGSSRSLTYEGYNCNTCNFDVCMACYRKDGPRGKN